MQYSHQNHPRENIFENIFKRRIGNRPVFMELYLQIRDKKGIFSIIGKIIQSSSLAFLGIVPVKTDGIQAIAMQTKNASNFC